MQRTEKDPLGERQVPADAYYGIQTARALENFPISGLHAPGRFVTATVLVKKAAAEANAALGRLDARSRDGHRRGRRRGARGVAARPVRRRRVPGRRRHVAQHERERGAGEPRRTRCSAGARGDYTRVHPNDHVNMGQSTNDVFPTATRLALAARRTPRLVDAARALARVARAKAARVRATCSRSAARICRTPCRSRSARSSAATRPASRAARTMWRGRRRSCGS